jgi:hypothetical protein
MHGPQTGEREDLTVNNRGPFDWVQEGDNCPSSMVLWLNWTVCCGSDHREGKM